MKTRDIPIEDIPQSTLDEVEISLRHYFVPILAFWNRKPVPDLKLRGSGTLIEIGGKGYILTAAHVWNAVSHADSLHFLVMAGPARVEIPTPEIRAETIWDPSGPPDWGPDLALLEIPETKLGTIKAHKSFLNFEQQRTEWKATSLQIDRSLWATYGVVGEFSNVTVIPEDKAMNAELVARAFFCGVVATHSLDGFDYYDTGANLSLPNVPSSFGGVSGGGLWQVALSISKSGNISWDRKRHFRGVAFWQSASTDERRIIRCHGPESIFEKARSEFGL